MSDCILPPPAKLRRQTGMSYYEHEFENIGGVNVTKREIVETLIIGRFMIDPTMMRKDLPKIDWLKLQKGIDGGLVLIYQNNVPTTAWLQRREARRRGITNDMDNSTHYRSHWDVDKADMLRYPDIMNGLRVACMRALLENAALDYITVAYAMGLAI